jgi:hypothetical protein
MADGDVKDYAGEKKKPSIALVISVGPKMPKKPEDTSKPDEAMKKAWEAMVEDNGTYEISKNEYGQAEMPRTAPPPPMGMMQPDPEQERLRRLQFRRQYQPPPPPGAMSQNPQGPVGDYGQDGMPRTPYPVPEGQEPPPNPYEQNQRRLMNEYYQKILPMHPDRPQAFAKSFEILKIRSAAPPRRPNPVRMRREPEPEPEPEMMPEPEEPEEDPAMKRRAMQAVMDKINSIRRQKDKFDEEEEVAPTSMEEMEGSLKDIDLSHFLKPPEER